MANEVKTVAQLETELKNVKGSLKKTISLLTECLALDTDNDQDDFDDFHDKINKHLADLRRKRLL
jgi:hypothetical protein